MAIAYTNSDTIQDNLTSSFNSGSSSNRYMFVTTSGFVTDVVYAGESLTLLHNIEYYSGSSTNGPRLKVWGIANPTSGTNNFTFTNGTGITAIVSVYSGVDPIPVNNYNYSYTTTSFASTWNVGLTTSINNSWVVGFAIGENFGRYLTSTKTKRGNNSINTFNGIWDLNGPQSPNVYSIDTSWSSNTGTFTMLAYEVKPYLQISISGPSSGNVNSASTNFTVTPDISINGTVTITPSGGGLSTPIILTFNNSSTPQNFTITPTDSGIVTLSVTNAVGLNNSSPLTYTANAVVPLAPTIGTATPLNTSASIAFTSNSNGGSSITGYTVTSTPGSFTGTGTSSPINVSGLSNGTGYTFTVRATNAIGNSSESSASNSVTPYVPATTFTFTGPSSGDVRSASTNFTITPNSTYNGTITITPTGIGSTGLSPVVLTWSLSSAAQTFTITPAASGSITLTPTNSMGITNPANLTYTANAVVPLAPTIGIVIASQGAAYVPFNAPSNNGGSSITLYTVTSIPGSITVTTDTPGTVQVLGLTNGTSYTFAVTATNSVGTSASSSASNAVIPTASSSSFTNSGPKFNITNGVGNLIQF